MAYLLELGIDLEVHGSSRLAFIFIFLTLYHERLHVLHLFGVIIIINTYYA